MAKNKIIFGLMFFTMFLLLISSPFLCAKNNFLQKTAMAKHDEGGGEGAISEEERARKEAEEFWEVDYPWNPPKPDLPHYINYIYQFSFWVGTFLAVLMIIIGGIQWTSSVSNPQVKAAAKDKITKAILGLVTLFGIFVVLRAINPDILNLEDITVEEYKPGELPESQVSAWEDMQNGNFLYKVNGTDIGYSIAKGEGLELSTNPESGHYSKKRGDYNSKNNTLPGESKEPCECGGGWGNEDDRCGTYCFHACRRYVSGEEIDNKIYGIITNSRCSDNGSKGDVINCSCYEAFNDTLSTATTFKVDNACECSGNQTPLCYSENHDFCMDYCKREKGYKFGYTSFCDAGADKDLIWCTCIK